MPTLLSVPAFLVSKKSYRKWTVLVPFVFLLSLHLALAQKIPARPSPPRLVNDFGNVLSPADEQMLEQKLVELDDSSSNQIAVVTVKSLDEYPIEDYAVKLFREWQIGQAKTNNGILLLVSVDDRKVRIEVGYGLEGAIPDGLAGDIIETQILPRFKENNYAGGINAGIEALGRAAVGEYKVARQRQVRDRSGSGGISLGKILAIVIIIIIISSFFGGGGGRGNRRRGGGLFGGGGFFPFPIPMGGGGFGGGGGGGDFGGFGGFGGGSSGGGGASGSW